MSYNSIRCPCTVNNYLEGVIQRTRNVKAMLFKRPFKNTTFNIDCEINYFSA